MQNKSKLTVLFLILILVQSCQDENKNDKEEIEKEIKSTIIKKINYNILIVSDLSNRLNENLYPRQLKDQEIIEVILKKVPQLSKNYNRLAFQKDKITYGLINPLEIKNFNEYKEKLTIDLGEFENNQFKRIDYLKNRGDITLNDDIEKFSNSIDEIYSKAKQNDFTADTWGFFKQGIDKNTFKLTRPTNTIKAKDVSRDIVIMLTDGFIELASRNSANSCKEKDCELLNTFQLEKFRKFYKENEDQYTSMKEAFKSSGYGIKAVNNPNLNNVEFLLLEINGRSKSSSGRITENITDYEILKLFWEDFLYSEGAEKVEVVKVASSSSEIESVVSSFLEE